jgi:hypothetical protein
VNKLKGDLAGNNKEIEALTDEAQKAAHTLGELQMQLTSKSQDLNMAAKAVEDLKAKLATLEKDLESTKEKEIILTEKLKTEETLREDAKNKFTQQQEVLSLWTNTLVNIAEGITTQLAIMDMKSWSFTVNDKEATSARLTKFFDGLIDALKTYHEDRSASFTNESRKFSRDVLYKVLLKVAYRNPDVDLSGAFKSLPQNTDVIATDKIVAPIADKVLLVPRHQGNLQN